MFSRHADVLQEAVRSSQLVNARERVRLALRQRLDEIGMTGRAFGRAFSANDGKGHVDTWVSGLLNGQFALSLDELDEAAHIVKLSPAELVKSDWEHQDYLSPTEHRIVTAMRTLPPAVRDHFLLLAEYLLGVLPEEIEMLREFRDLKEDQQRDVEHSIRVLRIARRPLPDLPIGLDAPARGERPLSAEHHMDGRRRKRQTKRKRQA